MNAFRTLRYANQDRNRYWDPNNVLTPLFFSTELAGEVGEVCNIVKKIERERLGLRGSRATIEQLGEEIGDAMICLDLLAEKYNIPIWDETRKKFNATSRKLDLPIFLPE